MNTTLEPSLRTIALGVAGSLPEDAATCCADGCAQPTSNGKPFCINHLERLAYVRKIRAEIASREEDARALRSIDPAGPIGREMQKSLRETGVRSFEALARELGISMASVEAHARAIESAGGASIVTMRLKRGETKRMLVTAGSGLKKAI